MEFIVFAVLYAGGITLFLFVMLCGEAAIFVRTPVAWLHFLIMSGPCIATECAPVEVANPIINSSCISKPVYTFRSDFRSIKQSTGCLPSGVSLSM